MATLPLRIPEVPEHDGVLDRLGRLLRLEIELGLAETREVLIAAVIAIGVAIVAAVALVSAVVVLLAGAFAPLFRARWEPLVTSGGGVALLAVAAIAWSVIRLRHLRWPRETLTSLEETWRWLAAQMRSRLTLR